MSKVERNSPCPCGSGKKYKKCHPGEYEPEAMMKKQVKSLTIHGCWVNDDYDQTGLATVIIAREMPDNGRFVITSFLCDIFCLGVKDVLYETGASESRLEFIMEMQPQDFEEADYSEIRNLVLGSVRYAETLGFQPYADFLRALWVIEGEEPFDYDPELYGRDGRPFYYTGPNDNYKQIFATLEANVGKGNFDYEIDERCDYNYDG